MTRPTNRPETTELPSSRCRELGVTAVQRNALTGCRDVMHETQ
jgi:hypothetical protein